MAAVKLGGHMMPMRLELLRIADEGRSCFAEVLPPVWVAKADRVVADYRGRTGT